MGSGPRGEYKATLPTYPDGHEVVPQYDQHGRQLVAVSLNDYADDSAFTVDSDMVIGIGFLADDTAPDSVDEDDIGIPRMSLNRNVYTQIRDAAGNERGLNVNASNEIGTEEHNSVDIKTAVELIDDAVYIDDADWTDDTSKHLLVGGLYQTTPQTITDGDVGPFQVDSHGNLKVVLASSTVDDIQEEDEPHSSGDYGSFALAVRNDVLGSLVDTDGDYAPFQVDADGALYVSISDMGSVVGQVDSQHSLSVVLASDHGSLPPTNESITETTASQDLSSAAMSEVTSIGADFRLNYVTLHFDAATTETVTISVDANEGANYDTVLIEEDLNAETDFFWQPDGNLDFLSGNEVKVEVTDDNGANTAYLVISTESR